MNKSYDIIIVGGGMVGMTIACALARQTSLSICIIEASDKQPDWHAEKYYPRVSAIALSSVRIFKSLDVWQSICEKRISPFVGIQVWDGLGKGEISFNSADIAESVLGYIIENDVIQSSLHEKIKQSAQIDLMTGAKLEYFEQSNEQVKLTFADGNIVQGKLAIAADGASSWLRQQADIEIKRNSYKQRAIVTTVKTMLPHRCIARQVFLESGPLAFLPLQEAHTSSIVWSLPDAEAEKILALDDDAFMQQLTEAFAYKLGEVIQIQKRFAFPLQKQHATTYFNNRVVLAGDAAHTVHPLAGQGVNMGLLDAASLVDVLVDAANKNRDIAARHILRRYERWRKADNAWMLTGVDVIKNLFASDKHTIQAIRSHGLSITNDLPIIRNVFTAHAVGDRGGLPTLANFL
jgi:2-octaprenylphenol hydroxylase